MHVKRGALGYSFVARFCYWLICESLIFARFLAAEMGVGLYTGRVICKYIWYVYAMVCG